MAEIAEAECVSSFTCPGPGGGGGGGGGGGEGKEILLIKRFLRKCHICSCYFKKENFITFMMI